MIKTIVLCLLLMAMPSFAQTIYDQASAVIAWDVVALPLCPAGSVVNATCPGPTFPSNAAGTIKYKIFKRGDAVSTGTYTNQEVTTNSATVVMAAGVQEYVGIESQFYGAATPTLAKTSVAKAWSNVAADCLGGNMFGFLYKPTPSKPTGIRISILEMLRRYTNG